jgi:type I restriction enzyme M protein
MVDRTRKEFSDADIAKITRAYHAWRGESDEGVYEDVPGFCKSASLEEVNGHGFVLNPGRYVGSEDVEADDTPFEEHFETLKQKLEAHFQTADKSSKALRELLARL